MSRPAALAHRQFLKYRDGLASLSLAERFRKIHDLNLWGAPTTTSGLGSEADATLVLARALADLCRTLDINTLVDAPCGDGRWIAAARLPIDHYIGVDIVPELVSCLADQHAGDASGDYMLVDLTTGPIPRGDLVLCRDCLVHLSFANAASVIDQVVASQSEWVAVTHFTDIDENVDAEDGDWRPLNLCLAPFFWPEPEILINEDCQEMDGAYRDKCLAVWRVADLSGKA